MGNYSLSKVVGLYAIGAMHDQRWDLAKPPEDWAEDILVYVDGRPLESVSGSQFVWDTRSVANVSHTLRVVAGDGEGHENVLETAVEVRNSNAMCYDFDRDGQINTPDIQAVVACWHLPPSDPGCEPAFDIDGDEVINMVDIMLVAAQWGRPCP